MSMQPNLKWSMVEKGINFTPRERRGGSLELFILRALAVRKTVDV